MKEHVKELIIVASELGWATEVTHDGKILEISAVKPCNRKLEIVRDFSYSIICFDDMKKCIDNLSSELRQFEPDQQTRLWRTKHEGERIAGDKDTIRKDMVNIQAGLERICTEINNSKKYRS